MIPCQVCGVATDREPEVRATHTGAPYRLGTCEDCATLWTADDEGVGVAVRAALRVLGKPEDDPRAAAAFEEAGVDVGPVMFSYWADQPRGGEVQPEPGRKPWAHVRRDGRAALRRGYAHLLAGRVAPEEAEPAPGPTPPPGDLALRGCAFCGVATAAEWTRFHSYGLSPNRTRMLAAALCPDCEEAHEAVGAIGVRAWTVAFCVARGLDYFNDLVLPGLRPFALADAEPGAAGWEFVGEIRPEPGPPTLADLLREVEALTARVAALEGGAA